MSPEGSQPPIVAAVDFSADSRAAVDRAAAESRVRLSLSGPFAPYAFADNW